MSTVSRSISVNRPIDAVFSAWADFTSFPDYLSDVKSVTPVGDNRTRWEVAVGGQSVVFEALVTGVEKDRRLTWTSTGGDVDHSGVAEFTPEQQPSTKVSVHIDWEPSGLGERLGSIVGVPEVAIGRQLDQFKDHLERQA